MAALSDPLLPCGLGEGSQRSQTPLHSTPVLSPARSHAQAAVRGIPFFQTKAVPAEGCCIYDSGGR